MLHQRLEPAPRPAVAPRPSLLVRLWLGWRATRRRRRTLADLAALDDRLLRDVGLRREDLADPNFDPFRPQAGRVSAAPSRATPHPHERRDAEPPDAHSRAPRPPRLVQPVGRSRGDDR